VPRNDLPAFARSLDRLAASLSSSQMETVSTAVGVAGKKDIAEAVARDLGGTGFSHWKIPIVGRFDPLPHGGVSFTLQGKAKGPGRVAEEGRHQGQSGPLQGPIAVRLTKSGRVAKRQGRHRKWNGQTRGKHTWTHATELIEQRSDERVLAAIDRIVEVNLD